MAGCSKDPLRFVQVAFPWGSGELEQFAGPDQWQIDVLTDIRDGLLTLNDAVRIATASGHGIGKSALVAWIIYWAMSTMEDTKGIVTANTEAQLKTKTWAELAKWHRLAINAHWFELTATALLSRQPGHDKTWRIDQIAWSETRPEAFAGLHNQGRRVLVVFDEASAIPDVIWEVTEGAFTDEDTELLWVAFGNPTRSRGRFADCFGRFAHRWKRRQIDSRSVKISSKGQLNAWVEDYGIDSDFVKVRVLGQFPSGDYNALLTRAEVDAAIARVYKTDQYDFAAKVVGVDVARQGTDDSVIAVRQGLVAWPLHVMHVPDAVLVAEVVAQTEDHHEADGIFVDATGGYGAGVIDALRTTMGRTCAEVYFSGRSTDPRFFNKRSEMAFLMAQWIKQGGALPDDELLAEELCALTYSFQGDKFRLVEKEQIRDEIGRSPDRADALALTFAFPVAPAAKHRIPGAHPQRIDSGAYDPFAQE
jgi:hypothetical protein